MLDQEHGDLQLSVDTAQEPRHRVDLFVADSTCGFIQEDQARPRDQRAGKLDALLNPEGKSRHGTMRVVVETDELDHLQGALSRRRLRGNRPRQRHACLEPPALDVHVVADHHVVEHGHRTKEGNVLKGARDAEADHVVRPHLEHGVAVEERRAAAGPVDAGDDVEERRLAGAVGTDQRDDLALVDVERDAVECHHTTEPDAEVAHLEQRHIGRILISQRLQGH